MSKSRHLRAVPEEMVDLPTSEEIPARLNALASYVRDRHEAPPPEVNVYGAHLSLSWSLRLPPGVGRELEYVRKIAEQYGSGWTSTSRKRTTCVKRIAVGEHDIVDLYIHLPEAFDGKQRAMEALGLG